MTLRKSARIDGEPVEDVVREAVFSPTRAQRAVKTRFWLQMRENPIVDVDHVTPSIVRQWTSENRVLAWWGEPGFKEWFLNRDEARERIMNLLYQCLDAAEEVLASSDLKAKTNMVKTMLSLCMDQQKRDDDSEAQKLEGMNRQQLEQYIRSLLPSSGDNQ